MDNQLKQIIINKKTNLNMRKLILAFLICTTTAAFAQKTNFSGTWKLDTTKTQFGGGPKYDGLETPPVPRLKQY